LKKLDRATAKQQLAIDYEKWVFDVEQRGDSAPDLATTMNWVERLDERIYHRSTRDVARTSNTATNNPSTVSADPDAMDWQANITRLVSESMEANFTKMGWNKKADGKKKSGGASGSLSSASQQAYEATQECWGCKKVGHVRKNCPQKSSNGGPGFGPGKVNATDAKVTEASSGNGGGEQ
jgi:hypothetical protein